MHSEVERCRLVATANYLRFVSGASFDQLDRRVLELLNLAPNERPRFFARMAAQQRPTRMGGMLTIDKALNALDRVSEFKTPSKIFRSVIWHQMEVGPHSLSKLDKLISSELAELGLKRVSTDQMTEYLSYQRPLTRWEAVFAGSVRGRADWEAQLYNCSIREFCSDDRLSDIQRLLIVTLLYQEAILLRAADRISTLTPFANSLLDSFGVCLGRSGQIFKALFRKRVLDWITSTHHWKCDLSPNPLLGSLAPILTKEVVEKLKRTRDRKRRDFEKVRILLSQNQEIPRKDKDLQFAYQQYMSEFFGVRPDANKSPTGFGI